jgi:glycerol-3-phosphate cytidylyltransferase
MHTQLYLCNKENVYNNKRIYWRGKGDKTMKSYKIGYIAGVFDLFHVGHLNLLRKAKDKCEYLIVGVLADELVMHFKNKMPCIPFNERAEIIENIKCVDRAVKVTMDNIDKIEAWKLYHFDCLFSGDDWKNEKSWNDDKKKLNQVGSNIEFFSYTKGISSTQIKEMIKNDIKR